MLYIDPNLYSYKYKLFLYAEAENQYKMKDYINSLVLSETGLFLEETFFDQIKDRINKLIQAIASMLGKFKESMDNLFKSDTGYLEKYKDIILKKKPNDVTINGFYFYKLSELANTIVPDFDSGWKLESNDDSEKKSELEKKMFPNFANLNSNASLVDNFKSYIRGDEKTVSAQDLNMTEIFNYCYSFKDNGMIDSIKKDQKKIDNASNNVNIKLSNLEKKYPNTQQNSNEGSFYSYGKTMKDYFNELSIENSKGNASGSGSPATIDKKNTMIGKNTNNIGDTNTTSSNIDTNAENITNNEELQSLRSLSTIYFQTAGDFLGAKLSIAQEIYNEYMKIIRWHVREFTGTDEGKNTDKVQQQARDYSKSNQKIQQTGTQL